MPREDGMLSSSVDGLWSIVHGRDETRAVSVSAYESPLLVTVKEISVSRAMSLYLIGNSRMVGKV